MFVRTIEARTEDYCLSNKTFTSLLACKALARILLEMCVAIDKELIIEAALTNGIGITASIYLLAIRMLTALL